MVASVTVCIWKLMFSAAPCWKYGLVTWQYCSMLAAKNLSNFRVMPFKR